MLKVVNVVQILLLFVVILLISLFHPKLKTTNSLIHAQSTGGSCGNIGNNLAVAFHTGSDSFDEAGYTLASVDSTAEQPIIMSTINNYSGTVIIRLGSGIGSYGPSAEQYAQMIKQLDNIGKPFVVQVSHNEPNCMEDKPITEEVAYVRSFFNALDSLGGTSNATYITGQIDVYCHNHPSFDQGAGNPNRAVNYLNAITSVDSRISGIALPLYTTPNFPDGISAAKLIDDVIAIAGKGKSVYITESGPYNSNFEEWLKAANLVSPKVVTILLFNSHGINPDPLFTYTRPFWNPQCREAIRTNCGNTQAVVTACNAAFTPLTPGSHSCREFCRGNTFDPCSTTPDRDCSFPFFEEEFLAPTASLTPEKITEISAYLFEYLYSGLAQSVNGFFARITAEQLNREKCENANTSRDQFLLGDCEEAEGSASVTVTLDPQVSSAITMPKEASTAQMQFENSSTYLYRQDGFEALEFGVIPKTQTRNDYWYRFGMLHKLKESCFQAPGGRVIGFNNHPLFGKVRCMNFQEFSCAPNCPLGLNNERIVFQGPLRMCIEVSSTEDPIEQAHRVVSCEKALNNQSITPPAIRSELNKLAVLPVARFPIIIATDNVAPNQDPEAQNNGLTIFERIVGAITHDILQLSRGDEQRFTTEYQLYVIPTAQDTVIASKIARDAFFPPDHQKDHSQPDNEFSFLGLTINLGEILDGSLGNIVSLINNLRQQDENRPFWKEKVPNDFRMDDFDGNGIPDVDPRFNLIHIFLNSARNYDKCTETINHIDNVIATATLDKVVGAQGNVISLLLDTGAAQLTTLFNRVEGETDYQNQIQCAIFPAWLEAVDKYAQQTARVLFPGNEESGESHKESFIDYQNQKKTIIQDVSNQHSGRVLVEQRECRKESVVNVSLNDRPDLFDSSGRAKTPCCELNEPGPCIEDRSIGIGLQTGYEVVNEGSGGSGNTIPLKGQGGIPLFSMLFNNGVFATKPIDHQPSPECKKYESFLRWLRGESGECDKNLTTTPPSSGSGTSNSQFCTNLPDETIPYRNTSINPKPVDELISHIRQNNGKLGGFSSSGLITMEKNVRDKYNEVVERSRAAGYNPAFVLAIWIEETGAGAYNASRQFGCGSSGFDGELNCFLGLFEDYSAGSSKDTLFKDCRQSDNPTLKEFLLFYSEGICPTVQKNNYKFCSNKQFPDRIVRFYKAVAG